MIALPARGKFSISSSWTHMGSTAASPLESEEVTLFLGPPTVCLWQSWLSSSSCHAVRKPLERPILHRNDTPANSSGWALICQPHKWTVLEKDLWHQLRYSSLHNMGQRRAVPTDPCPNFWLMEKINYCCFKPLTSGLVCNKCWLTFIHW